MTINYPISLDDSTSLPTRATGNTIPAVDSNDPKSAIIQLETKVGTGASTPTTTGHVLTVTGAGATGWAATGGATLTSLEGLPLVAGDTLYATAADTLARLPKGTAAQVLKMNAGATAPEWGTAAGGGGQTLYEAIVASSGGDYTTVGAAIAAGKKTIFVRNGTYVESALAITAPNITIVGESATEAIINIGANLWSVSAAAENLKIRNVKVIGSSGGWFLFDSTIRTSIENCSFAMVAGSGNTPINFYNSISARFINNYVYDASTDNGTTKAYFQGTILVSGNMFRINPVIATGDISLGALANFVSNHIHHSGGTGTGAFVNAGGISNITGNYITGRFNPNTSASSLCSGIVGTAVHCNIVGNYIYECKATGIYLSTATACIVSGNSIDYSNIGIRIFGSDNIISNNFHSSATSGVVDKIGLWIDSGDRNVVTHNNLQDNLIGILVDANLTSNQLLYNLVYNNTTPITDNSSGYSSPTVSVGNITA